MPRQTYVYYPLPDEVKKYIVDWAAANIADDQLDEQGGREANPHLTLCWGLPPHQRAQPIKAVLDQFRWSVFFLSDIEQLYFHNRHRSVATLHCNPKPFALISARIAAAFDTPYDFRAHITVAYLKSYVEVDLTPLLCGLLETFSDLILLPDRVVFCDYDKAHHTIPITTYLPEDEHVWPAATS